MKKSNTLPPRLASLILRIILDEDIKYSALGDFEEQFNVTLKERGKFRAQLSYWGKIFLLLPAFSKQNIMWRLGLLKNYFTIAFRNLKRDKGYSFIVVSGLILSISAFLLIFAWIFHHLGFDRFHHQRESVFRVMERRVLPEQVSINPRTPGPLYQVLKDNFPEIKQAARMAWTGERVIKVKNKKFYESEIITVDPEFFSIFSFPLIKGDRTGILKQPFSMVITEETAHKLFGDDEPLGRIISIDNKFQFTVTGIIENIPKNSHIQFKMAVPFDIVNKLGWEVDTWTFSVASTYVLLAKDINFRDVGVKIKGIVKSKDKKSNIELFLQPLTEIHLFSNFLEAEGQGLILYIYIFCVIGILILLLGSINFMNLVTARSERRVREISIRKVMGAGRWNLIRQFMVEAIILAFISLVIVPILLNLSIPELNRLTGESFRFSDFLTLKFVLFSLAITFLTGILSGSYPALYLSSFLPVKILRGTPYSGKRGSIFRKVLVFTQVFIFVSLFIVSTIITSQVDYLKSKDLGFDKTNIISIPLGISNSKNREISERMKIELLENPQIEKVTASFTPLTWFGTQARDVVFNDKRLDESVPIHLTSVDFDFTETFKIKMLRGRSFSRDYGTERRNLLINETMEKLLGQGSAINKVLKIGDTYEGKVVGVMQDFHMESVTRSLIGPLILFHNPNVNYIFVRLRPGNISHQVKSVKTVWGKVVPQIPFKFNFLTDELDRLYADIEHLGKATNYFALLAVVIACLGLFGLTSYFTEKRTREIGLRKILGSSIKQLLYLLCRDQLKLVLAATFLAWPLCWSIMENWLKGFAYHINLSPGTFIYAGLVALVVSLLTVSYHVVKASLTNPIDSIRYE
jgi:ABC-type antimicrobial peptide transport system permease subunit